MAFIKVFLIAAVLLGASCASREATPPIDIERQAFDDLRAKASEVISDPAREAEAIRLISLLEQELQVLRETIETRKQRVRELNADYDVPRTKLEAFLAAVEVEVRDNRQRVSQAHRALLAAVTADERDAVRKAHTKAMNTAIGTIQSI